MAVQRDSSYGAYVPSDIQDLLEELAEEGVDGRNPVWSVGRLDERKAGNGNGGSNQPHGNGNGAAGRADVETPPAAAPSEPDNGPDSADPSATE
jgi:hypothetical protein